MEISRKHSPQLCDHNWVRIFAFLIDVTEHTNEVHIELQETNNLVDKTEKTGFDRKLRWCELLPNQHVTQFTILKSPFMQRKKLSFFAKKSSMMPKSTDIRWQLKLNIESDQTDMKSV
jgi:hypothetical protein